MAKEKLILSFSGGRTSAYMTQRMLNEYSHLYDMIVLFANTGMEHEKTLKFVHQCDEHFNFKTVWLEANVYQDERKGTGYKITNYQDAVRGFNIFEDVIKKYGIFNASYLHCTREMKIAPINSYVASMGLKGAKQAIGIRSDEIRRVRDNDNILYPLVNLFPTDKIDVLDFWQNQLFDLEIEEFEGNCIGCHKKSMQKTMAQIKKYPDIFNEYAKIEDAYRHHKSNTKIGRVFHRSHIDMHQMIMRANDYQPLLSTTSQEGGVCGESCEAFDLV